jgi:hypothetical protein
MSICSSGSRNISTHCVLWLGVHDLLSDFVLDAFCNLLPGIDFLVIARVLADMPTNYGRFLQTTKDHIYGCMTLKLRIRDLLSTNMGSQHCTRWHHTILAYPDRHKILVHRVSTLKHTGKEVRRNQATHHLRSCPSQLVNKTVKKAVARKPLTPPSNWQITETMPSFTIPTNSLLQDEGKAR